MTRFEQVHRPTQTVLVTRLYDDEWHVAANDLIGRRVFQTRIKYRSAADYLGRRLADELYLHYDGPCY